MAGGGSFKTSSNKQDDMISVRNRMKYDDDDDDDEDGGGDDLDGMMRGGDGSSGGGGGEKKRVRSDHDLSDDHLGATLPAPNPVIPRGLGELLTRVEAATDKRAFVCGEKLDFWEFSFKCCFKVS